MAVATAEQIVEQAQLVVATKTERVAKVADADTAQKAADLASAVASAAEAAEDAAIATLQLIFEEFHGQSQLSPFVAIAELESVLVVGRKCQHTRITERTVAYAGTNDILSCSPIRLFAIVAMP